MTMPPSSSLPRFRKRVRRGPFSAASTVLSGSFPVSTLRVDVDVQREQDPKWRVPIVGLVLELEPEGTRLVDSGWAIRSCDQEVEADADLFDVIVRVGEVALPTPGVQGKVGGHWGKSWAVELHHSAGRYPWSCPLVAVRATLGQQHPDKRP